MIFDQYHAHHADRGTEGKFLVIHSIVALTVSLNQNASRKFGLLRCLPEASLLHIKVPLKVNNHLDQRSVQNETYAVLFAK